MEFAGLLEIAKAFGPPGLIIAWLIYDRERTDKRWLSHEDKRLKQDESRTHADKSMVEALTALKVTIEARR